MKLAGVVVLYHPNLSTYDNIATYCKYLSKVYILDNSEAPNNELVKKIEGYNNCTYISYEENGGTASRLNQGAQMAIDDGFTHLLTMDQDSSFNAEVFESYIEKISNYLTNHDDVGVFAVNFQPAFTQVSKQPREVLSTITSGSVIDLNIYKKIGGYNNDLFLDLVDADYCYRIFNAGFKTILFSDIILNHSIGYQVPGRSLKSFKITSRKIHSPIRMYYLVRNSLYLLNSKTLPPGAAEEIRKSLGLLKNNLLYNKRGEVVKYIVRGYLDYKKGKLGKFK